MNRPALLVFVCLNLACAREQRNGHGMAHADDGTRVAEPPGPSGTAGSPRHATSVGGTMAAPGVHPAKAAEELQRPPQQKQTIRVQTGPVQAGNATARAENRGKQGLTSDEVESVVKANRHEIDTCYANSAPGAARKSGRVDVKLVIRGDGRIHDPLFVNDEFQDEGLRACIKAQLSSWQFPTWSGEGVMRITLPFALNPK